MCVCGGGGEWAGGCGCGCGYGCEVCVWGGCALTLSKLLDVQE